MGYPTNTLSILHAVITGARPEAPSALRSHLERYALVVAVLHDPSIDTAFDAEIQLRFMELHQASKGDLAFFLLAGDPTDWRLDPPPHLAEFRTLRRRYRLDDAVMNPNATAAYLAQELGAPQGQLPLLLVADPRTHQLIWWETSPGTFATQMHHLIQHAHKGWGLQGLMLPFDLGWAPTDKHTESVVRRVIRPWTHSRRPSMPPRQSGEPRNDERITQEWWDKRTRDALFTAMRTPVETAPTLRPHWSTRALRYLVVADQLAGESDETATNEVRIAAYGTAVEVELREGVVQHWRRWMGVRVPPNRDRVDRGVDSNKTTTEFDHSGNRFRVHLNDALWGRRRQDTWRAPPLGSLIPLLQSAPFPEQLRDKARWSWLRDLGGTLRSLAKLRNDAAHGRYDANTCDALEKTKSIIDEVQARFGSQLEAARATLESAP